MTPFILLGWGLPLISVMIWATVMALFRQERLQLTPDPEDGSDRFYQLDSCWFESVDEDNRTYEFIIQVPIIITLILNAYVFLNVVSVVNVKLRAGQTSDYKQRLARSTLSLIPLLGIQYLGELD